MSRRVYLDWNATTPPLPAVVEAMARAARETWGNPASVHGAGRAAKAVVEGAREAVAALLGFDPRDVVLTSGGTEANNLAVARPFLGPDGEVRPGGRIVASRLEHPSITAPIEALAARGVEVSWLPVPASGRLDPADLRSALIGGAGGPVLAVVQSVNQETGVLQPVAEVVAIAHAAGAEVHVDAVQAIGRLGPETWAGADSVTLASHKLRGPKGIGALALRPGLRPRALLRGGAQERGLRPGTVDPVAAAGLAVAAHHAATGPSRWSAVAPLRDRLEARLASAGERLGVRPLRNGDGPRAPHVANASWPGWSGDELCAALDLEGVCVSSGSACAAGTAEPSPVIGAMHGAARARSAVRFSLGEGTTEDEVLAAISACERVLGRAARQS